MKDFHEANKRVRNQSWVLAENPADHYASLLRNAGFEIVKCDFKPAINYFNEEELQGNYIMLAISWYQKKCSRVRICANVA